MVGLCALMQFLRLIFPEEQCQGVHSVCLAIDLSGQCYVRIWTSIYKGGLTLTRLTTYELKQQNFILRIHSAAPTLANLACHHRIYAGLSLALYRNAVLERHGEFIYAIILIIVPVYHHHEGKSDPHLT